MMNAGLAVLNCHGFDWLLVARRQVAVSRIWQEPERCEAEPLTSPYALITSCTKSDRSSGSGSLCGMTPGEGNLASTQESAGEESAA
jgi:hypothetical protein